MADSARGSNLSTYLAIGAAALIVLSIAVVEADRRKRKRRSDAAAEEELEREIVAPVYDADRARARRQAEAAKVDNDPLPNDGGSASDTPPSAGPSTRSREGGDESTPASGLAPESPNATG